VGDKYNVSARLKRSLLQRSYYIGSSSTSSIGAFFRIGELSLRAGTLYKWFGSLPCGKVKLNRRDVTAARPVPGMHTSPQASTVGSNSFQPDDLFTDTALIESLRAHLNKGDFRSAIVSAFRLPQNDDYIYHATASVTLAQVQNAIEAGSSHGLHDWYLDSSTQPCGHPSAPDIAAYISLFDPSKSPANSLKGFVANAKKHSIRSSIGQYLTSKRYVHSSLPPIPKRKAPHSNPYVDFWSYGCHTLEWAGPHSNTSLVKASHHILPVFMHHFSCVCPSYEALVIFSNLAKEKTVIDMGSGNGYWTHILRREHQCSVVAVDSGQSRWRTMWISDTVVADGIQFLRERGGGKEDVLLMVYPIVSGQFTEKVIKQFKGDVICIAGTQNGNGYTGFKDEKADAWFDKNMLGWERIVQVPLPSFPGKDDALFVFRRTGDD
jgi:hypothetical protein